MKQTQDKMQNMLSQNSMHQDITGKSRVTTGKLVKKNYLESVGRMEMQHEFLEHQFSKKKPHKNF